jgi:surfeit locus 1 family protein
MRRDCDLALLRAILSTSRQSLHRHLHHPLKARFQPRPRTQLRHGSTNPPPSSNPDFISIVDAPPQIISTKRKHSTFGIITLSLIPLTAFALGTWQVQRLDWKTNLIAKFEDRLVRPPLPLPPRIDPSTVCDFDYRRVYATGHFLHSKEMLIGPRMHNGNDGYLVVTPLERGKGASTVLVNRGWISREKRFQQDRDPSSLPEGEVTVSGLLREPWKKNFFTPANKPEEGKFYFPDVQQMAAAAGCEPVWIEETMEPSLLASYDREAKGTPIGRPAEVNLRNNHTQYIFTW